VLLSHKEAHPTSINCIKFIPDTEYLATGSSDDTIRVWDFNGKEIKIFIGHIAPVTQIDFTNFNNEIIMVSSSEDNTVKIWNYSTAELLKSYSDATNIVKVVRFINDKVITGSKDKHLRIYNLQNDQLLFDLETGAVTALAVHPGPQTFCVIGTVTNHLVVIDYENGSIIKKSLSHELPIQGLDFSSDGKLLVSSSLDKQVKVWNVISDFSELVSFQAHTSAVTGVRFCPNKDSFASCGFDRNTHIFQPGNIKPVKRFKGPKLAVTDLAWNETGDKLAVSSADGSFRIYNVDSPDLNAILTVEATKQYITCLAIHPDKNDLFAGFADGSIKIFPLEGSHDNFESSNTIPEAHKGIISWLGISQNSTLISTSEEKFIRVWNLETLQNTNSSESDISHTLGVKDAIIHPTESWCMTVSADTFIKKWQIPEMQLLGQFSTHKYAVNSITFSTDFEYIVTTSNDKRVVLHDKNMKELFTYKGHTDSVLSSCFSSENRFLFTGARNGRIIIFDVQKEKEVNTLDLHTDAILKFIFSNDYKFLAIISADNHCSIFSYKSTEISFELKNIFLGSFSGNPTDIIWKNDKEKKYSLLISTYLGELIELTILDELEI
jgi:WD40 repeat protein